MIGPNRRTRTVILVLTITASIALVGCGKYGKPVRKAPAPREQAARAELEEKRYKLGLALDEQEDVPKRAHADTRH